MSKWTLHSGIMPVIYCAFLLLHECTLFPLHQWEVVCMCERVWDKITAWPFFSSFMYFFLCNIFSKEVESRESLVTLPTALSQLPICMRPCVSVHHLQQAAPTWLFPRTARARLTFAYWVIGHWWKSIMEFSLTWFIPGMICHEEEGHGTKSLTSYR